MLQTCDDTYKLQSYCLFNISRRFGFRGGEVFAKLTRHYLKFAFHGNDDEYVTLNTDFLTKNKPGGLNAGEFHSCCRVQDWKQVQAFDRLLKLLNPKIDRQFQRALPGCRPTSEPWFATINAPIIWATTCSRT